MAYSLAAADQMATARQWTLILYEDYIMRKNHTVEERLWAVLACLDDGQRLVDVAQEYRVEVQPLRV